MVFMGEIVWCLIVVATLLFQGEITKALVALLFACALMGVLVLTRKEGARKEAQN